MVHTSCITCPRDLPDMYTHSLGPNGSLAWVYISGKSLGYMIQLLHERMGIGISLHVSWEFSSFSFDCREIRCPTRVHEYPNIALDITRTSK